MLELGRNGVLSALLLAACGTNQTDAADSTATETKPAKPGRREVFLSYCDWQRKSTLPAESLVTAGWLGPGASPPEGSAGELFPDNVVDVTVTKTGVSLQGGKEIAWDADDLARKLNVGVLIAIEDAEEVEATEIRWRLYGAPDAPAVQVAAVLDRLALGGITRGSLVFGFDGDDPPPPPDPALADSLRAEHAATRPSERARWFLDHIKPAADACAPLTAALEAPSSVPLAERCDNLANGAAAALDECPKQAGDGASAPTLLWFLLSGAEQRSRVTVDATIDWVAAPRPVEPSATWAEVIGDLVKGPEPLALPLVAEDPAASLATVGAARVAKLCREKVVTAYFDHDQACMLSCARAKDDASCLGSVGALRGKREPRLRWLRWLCDERASAEGCRALAKMHRHGTDEAHAALTDGIAHGRRKCADASEPRRKENCQQVRWMLLEDTPLDAAQVKAATAAACTAGDEGMCTEAESGSVPKAVDWKDPTAG